MTREEKLQKAAVDLLTAIQANTTRLWEDTLELTAECVILEETILEFEINDSVEERSFNGIQKEIEALTKIVEND